MRYERQETNGYAVKIEPFKEKPTIEHDGTETVINIVASSDTACTCPSRDSLRDRSDTKTTSNGIPHQSPHYQQTHHQKRAAKCRNQLLWLGKTFVRVLSGAFTTFGVLTVFVFSLPFVLMLFLVVCLHLLRFQIQRCWSRCKNAVKPRAVQKNKPYKVLTGGDAYWAVPKLNQDLSHIAEFCIMAGTPDLDALRSRLWDQVVNRRGTDGRKIFPKLTMYVKEVSGRYMWVEDDDFSPEKHVLLYPDTIEESPGQQKLLKVISELCSTPLPKDQAGWSLTIIQLIPNQLGKQDHTLLPANSPRFAVFVKIHHSIMDGVAALKLFLLMFQEYMSAEDMRRLMPPIPSRPQPTLLQRLYINMHLVITTPWRIVQAHFHKDRNALHGKELSGQRHLAWASPVSLTRIKAIKSAMGASVNDVIVSCISGALRRHLLQIERAKAADPQRADITIPKRHQVTAFIPVSLHPPSGPESIMEPDNFGNVLSVVTIPLPVHDPEPLGRLRTVRREIRKLVANPLQLFFVLKYRRLVNLLPGWLRTYLFGFCEYTVAISNIPGPLIPVVALGYPVVDHMFFHPCLGKQGLGMAVLTYGGYARLGVLVDKALIRDHADAQSIAEDFLLEVEELEKDLELRNNNV